MSTAALAETGRTPPCRHCDGEGRIWRSRHGGLDPDIYDAGPCDHCQGTGDQVCQYCQTGDPAVARWTYNGTDHYVCEACHEEWLAEEAADAPAHD
jgi:DnaJ-class molecular chaperone